MTNPDKTALGPWVDKGAYFEREAQDWAERRLPKDNLLNLQPLADNKILDGITADFHAITGLTACGVQSAVIEALLSRERIAELTAQLAGKTAECEDLYSADKQTQEIVSKYMEDAKSDDQPR